LFPLGQAKWSLPPRYPVPMSCLTFVKQSTRNCFDRLAKRGMRSRESPGTLRQTFVRSGLAKCLAKRRFGVMYSSTKVR